MPSKLDFCHAVLLLLFSGFCQISPGQENASVLKYDCPRALGEIIIDGALSESSWDSAETLYFFIPVSLDRPESLTRAKLLWDDKYLYVGFEAQDLDLQAQRTKRDSDVFRDDVLEIFIQPDTDAPRHHNFEINPLGTLHDGFAGGGAQAWNIEGIQIGIQIQGTLNNDSDRDEGWSLEVAVPFSELPDLNKPAPEPGDRWKFHLARYDYSKYLEEGKELSSTAPLSKINFHYRPDWIDLVFQK
jgi:hypothetical protein